MQRYKHRKSSRKIGLESLERRNLFAADSFSWGCPNEGTSAKASDDGISAVVYQSKDADTDKLIAKPDSGRVIWIENTTV